MIRIAIRAMVFVCCATAVSAAPSDLLTPRETQVVNAYLRINHYLRRATRADCRCDAAIESVRRRAPGFEPFVARGDFNGDGQADVAVLYFNRDPYIFAPGVLAVFNGPFHGIKPPSFVRGDVPLENRRLFLSRPAPHRLMFGRFDGTGCAYRPFGDGYREDCAP